MALAMLLAAHPPSDAEALAILALFAAALLAAGTAIRRRALAEGRRSRNAAHERVVIHRTIEIEENFRLRRDVPPPALSAPAPAPAPPPPPSPPPQRLRLPEVAPPDDAIDAEWEERPRLPSRPSLPAPRLPPVRWEDHRDG